MVTSNTPYGEMVELLLLQRVLEDSRASNKAETTVLNLLYCTQEISRTFHPNMKCDKSPDPSFPCVIMNAIHPGVG